MSLSKQVAVAAVNEDDVIIGHLKIILLVVLRIYKFTITNPYQIYIANPKVTTTPNATLKLIKHLAQILPQEF